MLKISTFSWRAFASCDYFKIGTHLKRSSISRSRFIKAAQIRAMMDFVKISCVKCLLQVVKLSRRCCMGVESYEFFKVARAFAETFFSDRVLPCC